MNSYEIVSPPEDDNEFTELAKEIAVAAIQLGRPIEAEGFLQAWSTGLKIVTERNKENKIVGLAFMALGQRWLFKDITGSVLFMKAESPDGMLKFIKMICKASNATMLYVEDEAPITVNDKEEVYRVRGIKL